MPKLSTLIVAALGAAQALAAAPALATGPLPGINVGLGQKPGGIVASAASDGAGTVSFFNLPAGRYRVFIDNSKLSAPAVASISVGREAPTLTDPIPVDRRPGAKTSNRGFAVANGGNALTLVIPPGSGAARGAKPLAASGAAPRDASPASTIVVVLTKQ